MRIYKTAQSTTEFFNVKFNKIEKLNLENFIHVNRNKQDYIGWLKIFYKEIPDEFLLFLTTAQNYIINIYKEKNKDNGKILAIVLPIKAKQYIKSIQVSLSDIRTLKAREFAKHANISMYKSNYMLYKNRGGDG